MKRFRNILVATDTGLETHPIVDEAAAIAQHNGARLKIVDEVPEMSYLARLAMSDHTHVLELLMEEKRQKLENLAAPLRAANLPVETKVLRGQSSVEIIREVLRADHDLVIRVAKGRYSKSKGYFGATGFRLLRKCPVPVWLVAPNTTPQFNHVAACVDSSATDEAAIEVNDAVYELANSISHYNEGRFSVVHAWFMYGDQLVHSRVSEAEFAGIEKQYQKQSTRALAKFLKRHNASIDDPHVHLLKGEPSDAIAEFAHSHDVDLVVMGTVGRSGLSGLLMGNTAERILNRLQCSVLALKPAGFVTPIRLD